MKKKSLKTVIIQPVLIIIVVIVVSFMWLWNLDYNWVSQHSSEKIISSVMEQTKTRMKSFLSDPVHINKMLVTQVQNEKLYGDEDLKRVEDLFLESYKDLYRDIPQINNISYGDETKRYLGMRETHVGVFNLMLQDKRTSGTLNIYEGTDPTTTLVSEIEGYNPLIRPWYKPVIDKKSAVWTDIYINVDERMEATLSTSMPIRDASQGIVGVICLDITLSGIHDFLSQDASIGSGVVFLLDNQGRVVAQSTDRATMIRNENDPAQGTFIIGKFSDEPLVKKAVWHMDEIRAEEVDVKKFKIDGKAHFMSIQKLEGFEDLNWKIGVVIPEEDLIGNLRYRQVFIALGLLVLIAIGTGLVSIWLSRMIKPILDSTQMASDISKGMWGTEIHLQKSKLRETDALVEAFNTMSRSLKQSFEEVKRQEAQYRLLVENAEDMIYSFKLDGRLISVNKSFENQFQVKREEVIDKVFFDVFSHLPQLHKLKERLKSFENEPEKISFIFDHKSRDNKRIVLNVTWIPVFDKKGNLESIQGTNTNVTDLIVAKENLEKVYHSEKERLEYMLSEKDETLSLALFELIEKEKMASLGNLVSGVAHEINTPLGVAVSAASFMENTQSRIKKKMEDQSLTKTDLVDYLEKIHETTGILNTNLHRAAELVKSFKAIAIDQHMDDVVQVHMKAYLETLLLSLKHEYKNKGHSIQVNCAGDLVVYTRPGAISQIFTNLIMNSLIHGFATGVSGIMRIDILEKGDTLQMTYFDNGKGMSKEVLTRMYEPFFTTNRGKGGSGLGLNIVYNLVKRQLGGAIEAESIEGEFTRFIIEIPKGEGPKHGL